MTVNWKTRFLREVHEKQIQGELPKIGGEGGGLDSLQIQGGGLDKKERGGAFEWGEK